MIDKRHPTPEGKHTRKLKRLLVPEETKYNDGNGIYLLPLYYVLVSHHFASPLNLASSRHEILVNAEEEKQSEQDQQACKKVDQAAKPHYLHQLIEAIEC